MVISLFDYPGLGLQNSFDRMHKTQSADRDGYRSKGYLVGKVDFLESMKLGITKAALFTIAVRETSAPGATMLLIIVLSPISVTVPAISEVLSVAVETEGKVHGTRAKSSKLENNSDPDHKRVRLIFSWPFIPHPFWPHLYGH